MGWDVMGISYTELCGTFSITPEGYANSLWQQGAWW